MGLIDLVGRVEVEAEVAVTEDDASRLDGSDLGGVELVEREEVEAGAVDSGLDDDLVDLGLGTRARTVEWDAREEEEVAGVVVAALFDDLRGVGEDGREESVGRSRDVGVFGLLLLEGCCRHSDDGGVGGGGEPDGFEHPGSSYVRGGGRGEECDWDSPVGPPALFGVVFVLGVKVVGEERGREVPGGAGGGREGGEGGGGGGDVEEVGFEDGGEEGEGG